jgi:hypothetical protein
MRSGISKEDDWSCLGVSGLSQVIAWEKGNPGSEYKAVTRNREIFPFIL